MKNQTVSIPEITVTDLRRFIYDPRQRDLLIYSTITNTFGARFADSPGVTKGKYHVIISRNALNAMRNANGENLDLIASFLNCAD